MDSKKKIVLKKLKNHSPCILHPESTLVFKSSQEKLVIGRYDSDNDEIISLDDVCLELCAQNNFKYDTSLVEEVSEDGSGTEEKQPEIEDNSEQQTGDTNLSEDNTDTQENNTEQPENNDIQEDNTEQTENNDTQEDNTEQTENNDTQEDNTEQTENGDEETRIKEENDKFVDNVYMILRDVRKKHEDHVRNIEDDYKKIIGLRDQELSDLTTKFIEIQTKFENIKKFMM